MLDIVQAYLTNKNPELAAQRLAVCKVCPLKMKIVDICTVCGCHISKKVKSIKKVCPRWNEVKKQTEEV